MAKKATPFLMFEGDAERAMTLYTSLFADSAITQIDRYTADGPGPEGTVYQAHFTVAGQPFMAIDSHVNHGFTFTPAFSIFVECESEDELGHAFEQLSSKGKVMMPLGNYGFSQKFGWCEDRFGVSWQLNLA